MNYSYDNVGNTKFINETINGTIQITTSQQYDALNRLTQNIQGSKRIDYAYNALGQVTNKKRYADIQGTMFVAETNHTYDSLNRLTNITHSKGANTIASYTQSYDAGSKITGINSTDGNSTFNYDDTDQLTGADYSYQTDENYTYDANGNRTNTGYITGINNRLLEDSKYRYEYDKVGNRTKRTDKSTNEVTEYSWDIRDRLTGIRVINALGDVIRTANYVYDVYDQRIAKIVDLDGDGLGAATTERFVYGSNQNIALVFDGNGTLTHRYMFSNGVDQIEADEQLATGTTLWALPDHLGSVRDVVDNSGATQNHIVYDAFGNITSQSNSSVIFRFGYTARELDGESGLQFNRARYLDTFTGRFISEDKIGFAGKDWNLSRYVSNNVVNNVDSSGEFKIELRYRLALPASIPQNSPSPFHHTDVVITDDNGKMRSYWAVRGNTGISAGYLIADRELNYREGTEIYVGDSSKIQLLLENKKQKCSDDTLRKNKNIFLEDNIKYGFFKIQEARIPYQVFGTNSNSAAFQVIRDIGIVKNLTPISGVNPLNWDLNPYFSLTNPRYRV